MSRSTGDGSPGLHPASTPTPSVDPRPKPGAPRRLRPILSGDAEGRGKREATAQRRQDHTIESPNRPLLRRTAPPGMSGIRKAPKPFSYGQMTTEAGGRHPRCARTDARRRRGVPRGPGRDRQDAALADGGRRRQERRGGGDVDGVLGTMVLSCVAEDRGQAHHVRSRLPGVRRWPAGISSRPRSIRP